MYAIHALKHKVWLYEIFELTAPHLYLLGVRRVTFPLFRAIQDCITELVNQNLYDFLVWLNVIRSKLQVVLCKEHKHWSELSLSFNRVIFAFSLDFQILWNALEALAACDGKVFKLWVPDSNDVSTNI